MIGIEQAARSLGLSRRQVYRRVSTLRSLLSGHLQRGRNNSLLLDGSAIEILRTVEDYRNTGDTVSRASERIRDSILEKPAANSGNPVELPDLWRIAIEAKDEVIASQRAEIAHLRGEVERLLPLALPAPRRGLRLFRRRHRGEE